MESTAVARINKELQMMHEDPPPGISCYPKEDHVNDLEASIEGPEGTPYAKGIFKLSLSIPNRYPFEPPTVLFITKIYHPNIDSGGRICLDTLKEGAHGAWKPSQNIKTLLLTIQALLSTPGLEDPLVPEISAEYQDNFPLFAQKAKQWTTQHATGDTTTAQSSPENPTQQVPEQRKPLLGGTTPKRTLGLSKSNPSTEDSTKRLPGLSLSTSKHSPRPQLKPAEKPIETKTKPQVTKPTEKPIETKTEKPIGTKSKPSEKPSKPQRIQIMPDTTVQGKEEKAPVVTPTTKKATLTPGKLFSPTIIRDSSSDALQLKPSPPKATPSSSAKSSQEPISPRPSNSQEASNPKSSQEPKPVPTKPGSFKLSKEPKSSQEPKPVPTKPASELKSPYFGAKQPDSPKRDLSFLKKNANNSSSPSISSPLKKEEPKKETKKRKRSEESSDLGDLSSEEETRKKKKPKKELKKQTKKKVSSSSSSSSSSLSASSSSSSESDKPKKKKKKAQTKKNVDKKKKSSKDKKQDKTKSTKGSPTDKKKNASPNQITNFFQPRGGDDKEGKKNPKKMDLDQTSSTSEEKKPIKNVDKKKEQKKQQTKEEMEVEDDMKILSPIQFDSADGSQPTRMEIEEEIPQQPQKKPSIKKKESSSIDEADEEEETPRPEKPKPQQTKVTTPVNTPPAQQPARVTPAQPKETPPVVQKPKLSLSLSRPPANGEPPKKRLALSLSKPRK